MINVYDLYISSFFLHPLLPINPFPFRFLLSVFFYLFICLADLHFHRDTSSTERKWRKLSITPILLSFISLFFFFLNHIVLVLVFLGGKLDTWMAWHDLLLQSTYMTGNFGKDTQLCGCLQIFLLFIFIFIFIFFSSVLDMRLS